MFMNHEHVEEGGSRNGEVGARRNRVRIQDSRTFLKITLRHVATLARRMRRALNMADHTPIRLLIVDDHPTLAAGVATMLAEHGIETVDSLKRVQDLVEGFERTKPDVVILDIRFRSEEPTGIEEARALLARHPDAKIVFYTQFDQDSIIDESYKAGAAAFVVKDTPIDALVKVLRDVVAGLGPIFLPEIAARLARLRVRGDETPQGRLDKREYEVFRMLAYSFTQQEIAERLSLSVKTIGLIAQEVKRKLDAQTSSDLTALAVKHQTPRP